VRKLQLRPNLVIRLGVWYNAVLNRHGHDVKSRTYPTSRKERLKMRHIRLLCLVFAGILAALGCKKQEPEPARQTTAEVNTAPVQSPQTTEPTGPDESLRAESVPVPAPEPAQPIDPAVRAEATDSLERAVAKGDFEQAQSFIAAGADVTRRAANGATPLHIALIQGHEDIAVLLITKGADMNARMDDGTTPLHFAAMRGCMIVTEFLADEGADVNAMSESQGAPLHAAAAYGHRDTVELLLGKGADINIRNRADQTPLTVAKQRGHKDVADLLSERGAQE